MKRQAILGWVVGGKALIRVSPKLDQIFAAAAGAWRQKARRSRAISVRVKPTWS
jgi:hypothetical protein